MRRPLVNVRRILTIAVAWHAYAALAQPAAPPVAGEQTRLIAAAKTAMMVNPENARRFAVEAKAAAEKQAPSSQASVDLATAEWIEGEALIRLNDPAKAKLVASHALSLIAHIRPVTKLHGDLLVVLATSEEQAGDPTKALGSYLKAYSVFSEVGDLRGQAKALKYIGLIYHLAGNYPKALYYFTQSSERYSNDRTLNLSINQSKANVFYEMYKYSQAKSLYLKALELGRTLNSPRQQIYSLLGLAACEIELHNFAAAKKSIDTAMALLSDPAAQSYRPLVLGARAELAMAQNRPVEAERLAEQALRGAGDAAETQQFKSVQETAYHAYKAQGDAPNALRHYEVFKRLEDEGRTLAASTNAALLSAQFDFANQNARITALRATALERDIRLSKLRARQNLLLAGAAAVIVLLIAIGMFVTVLILRRSRNRIRVANAQLTVVNAELTEALLAKSQFLATTSHEIRTPLNGVLGMTQILLADRTLTPGVRERVTLMQGAGEAMRGLIDDILDFAKLDAGKLELNPLETDLPRLLDETVAFWRGRATEAGLTLNLERDGCPERVLHDGRRLQQVLANLLSNAIKFTAEGTVTVRVSIAGAGADEQIAIAVADSGIGIPETAFETIFEKFRQLDAGTTRRFGGTGLGLAISRTLARAMGGDITVTSEPGAGSVFTVTLPCNRVAAAPRLPEADAPAAGPVGALTSARLLLVGANPGAQGLLRAVLTVRVASFAVAYDLDAATGRVRRGEVDLVLVEATALAGVPDGVADLVALAEVTRDRGVAMAALWPAGFPEAAVELADAGITVIAKPVGAPALIAALTRALSLKSTLKVIDDAVAG